MKLLVDTGATDSVLSSEFYFRVPTEKRPSLESDGVGVRNADGSRMNTLGRAWVEVQIGKTTCPVHAVFGSTGEVEGILGMDFLLSTKGSLDFRSCELSLHGETIKCVDQRGSNLCARVIAGETTRLPAGHEALVPAVVRGEHLGSKFGLIEPSDRGEVAQKGMVVARVLVNSEEEVLPVRVFNPGKRECVVKEGTMVGFLTPVEAGGVDSSALSPPTELSSPWTFAGVVQPQHPRSRQAVPRQNS